jgi:hypothetical protein
MALLLCATNLAAQEPGRRDDSRQRRELSVALEPARVVAWPRILAGVLVLVVVLAALGRRRALRESETES